MLMYFGRSAIPFCQHIEVDGRLSCLTTLTTTAPLSHTWLRAANFIYFHVFILLQF